MRNYPTLMKKSYNIFEADSNGKNIFHTWDMTYWFIYEANFEDAFFDLVQLNGVNAKVSAFF